VDLHDIRAAGFNVVTDQFVYCYSYLAIVLPFLYLYLSAYLSFYRLDPHLSFCHFIVSTDWSQEI